MLRTIEAFDRIGEENAFAVLARANALAAQGRDIINLGIGQPDFRTPEFIVEAAIKALRDGHHGYTPANGIPQLREAVAADLHKRFKVEVSPESVMIMPGGKPTMFMSILMFGAPGVDILYPDPGFPIYRSMIEFTGARPVPVPIREENGFAFSAEETLKLITPQTRLLIVNSPANPTGGVTPKAEIDKLVAGLEKFPDVCIMSDEIYDQMTYDGEHACVPVVVSVDPRSPDPSERLVEDLRHDRLAARLRGVSRKALRLCAQARGQPALVRQRADAVRRPRRAAGPAGRGAQDDCRVRQKAKGRHRRTEQAARRLLHRAEGRVLRVSRTSSAPAGRPRSSQPRCSTTRAWPPSAARTSACSAKATSACRMPTPPRTFSRRWIGWASFWRSGRWLEGAPEFNPVM